LRESQHEKDKNLVYFVSRLSGSKLEVVGEEFAMSKGKGGFKNIKLGKNIYRQLKRRGPPQPIPDKRQKPDRGDQGDRQKSS
jgi:hypothetical protein